MEDSPPASAHWCHQCGAQTAAERVVGGAHGDLVCADCGGGFIEAMESARALIHVHRAVRRHDRSRQWRFHNYSAALRRLEATILEADLSSSAFRQEVCRLVHTADVLPLHSSLSGLHDATSNDVIEEAHDTDDTSTNSAHSDHVLVAEGMPSNTRNVLNGLDAPSQLVSSGVLRASGTEANDFFSHVITRNTESTLADLGHYGIERVIPVELFHSRSEQEELGENVESHEDEDEGGSMQLHDNIDEDDDASDSDVEMSVLSDWDPLDEVEWDEVEGGENGFLERDDDVSDGVSVGHGYEGSQATSSSEGNPGDYVGTRGFEELLQQFMDSVNTHKGPPPAAKSAIEGLPTVLVQHLDVDNGSALCAICKDLVECSEPAKQLPCLHLYHSECVLPWLSVRNSCPLCRYELPTDDPDYEEQRKRESLRQITQQHEHSNSDSAGVLHEAGGQELGRERNWDGDSNVTLDISKGEAGEDTAARGCPGVGPSGSEHSRRRGSLLDGIAGPLVSVVGLVVVSCLGNLLLGGSSQRCLVNNQVGSARETRSGRSWWGRLFG